MIPEEMADAFEACGIPYRQEGWYPHTPPRDGAYATVLDAERIVQDDRNALHMSYHSYAVLLYSPDPADSRARLRDALLANGVSIESIACNGNNQDTKLFETLFSVENEYIEKWSDD